ISVIPTITGEQVLKIQKLNKKGKPVGKAVFAGFTLQYSTAMNSATAGLAANYHMVSYITKHAKKKTFVVQTSVALTAKYDPATHSVQLIIQGKPKFTSGGQITMINTAPNGVSSAAGALLDGRDTELTISPKATGITLG